MTKGHNIPASSGKGTLPVDAREALQWFVNNFGLYIGSTRGLFISDWTEEREATREAAIINLKSRGFSPLALTGETLYKQADYLWKEARTHTQFGRPLASKLEVEMNGSDIVIVDCLEAPENSRHLWYLFNHLLYPRAVAGKATVITTPLSFSEFVKYGQACPDPDFCGKSLNWEKLIWLIEASMITPDLFNTVHEHGLPPMLKAEYALHTALKERGIECNPQHVLGDYMLDFALVEKERRLNIEVDTVSALGGSEVQRQEAKRNLVLLSDGWQVLKFTTAEILENKAACVDVVDEVWRTGRKKAAVGRLITGNNVPPLPELPVHDDVQMNAIAYGGGPAVIAGGAGTGKTTCVIQRVAYLIGQGISADSILVITHSTDTQRSLKRALEHIIEKQAMQRLSVSSWQDLGARILKENLPAIKRKPPLKVEPNPQKIIQRLLAKAKKEIDPAKLELSVDLDEFYIAAVISMYKSHLISPKQAKEDASTYGEQIIAKVYQQLEDQLQKANRVDRDDVIAMSVQVLLENPEVRSKYQRQFEFVLVDEYQDATVAQDMLARVIAAPQDNLFLSGDEDETIAEAKNACPELLVELSLRMPQARCFMLERNWRSHPAIVDHARQLLSGLTKRRINKEFISAWGQAPATAVVGPAALNDEHEEANWVADEVLLLADSGRAFGDIAVVYRHHVYATILEEALDRRGVRYQSANPINNFIPDEVEDMMAFLKLVMDPDGPRARESFERVCSLRVKEVDPKLSGTIASFAEANNLSYLKAVEIYSEATADQSCRELEQLVRIIRTMHQEKLPPAETISLIRRTQRLNDYYRSVKVPPGLNYEPLKKLTQLEEESRSFKSVPEFVKHIAGQKQTSGGGVDNGVQVLPLLDTKGLEFPVVFMVGMAEGIFPAETVIDLEEERRICYVGFTRAKELLYLSYPVMFSGAMLQPSHFLVDARLMAAPPPMHRPAEQQVAYMEPAYAPVPPAAEPAFVPPPPVAQPMQPQPVAQPMQPQPVPQPVQPQPVPQPVQPQPVHPQPVAQPVQPQPVPQPVQPQPVPQPVAQPVQPQPVPQPVQPEPRRAPQAPPAQPAQPAAMQPAMPQPQPVSQPAQPQPVPAAPQQTQGLPPLAEPPSRPGRTAKQPAAAQAPPSAPESHPAVSPAALHPQPAAPSEDPFKIHMGETPVVRSGMPALPKSKGAAHQQPAAVPPPEMPVSGPVPPAPPPNLPVAAPEPIVQEPPAQPPGQPHGDVYQQPQPAAAQHDPFAWPMGAPAEFQHAQPHDQQQLYYQQPEPTQPEQHFVQAQPEPTQQQQHFLQAQPEPHPHAGQHYEYSTQVQHQQLPYQPEHNPFAYHAEAHPVPEAHHPLCPSCHTALEANARFCGECGYTLPERVPACPTCGAPLESSAKFCGECGTSLHATVASNDSHLTGNVSRMQELKDKQHGWVDKIFKMLE